MEDLRLDCGHPVEGREHSVIQDRLEAGDKVSGGSDDGGCWNM